MAETLETSKLFRYLLGQMDDSEKETLEKAFFQHDDIFEQLEAAEDELIDSYVRSKLSASDRALFEKNFLNSPKRIERVHFARTLHGYVQQNAPAPEPRVAWWKALFTMPAGQVALVAAAILIAIMISQMMRVNQPAPSQQAQAPAPPKETTPLPTPAPETPKPPIVNQVLAFALSPGLTRGLDGTKILQITPTVKTVQLQLNIEAAEHPRYQVTLQTPEGEDVWSQKGLRAKSVSSGKAVIVDVPASVLKPRDYIVKVSGATGTGNVEDVAEYTFRAARK